MNLIYCSYDYDLSVVEETIAYNQSGIESKSDHGEIVEFFYEGTGLWKAAAVRCTCRDNGARAGRMEDLYFRMIRSRNPGDTAGQQTHWETVGSWKARKET